MKTFITAAAIALFALPGFAQEATVFDDTFASSKSRAEVRAEVMAALARGERLSYGEHNPQPYRASSSTLTRADVHAEVLAALARGERLSYGEANVDLPGHRGAVATPGARLAAVPGTSAAK